MKTPHTCIVTTTFASRAEAAALAKAVVAARLAACAQMLPIRSVYWWKGRVQAGAEVRVQFKTRRIRAAKLLAFIRARHSYDVPEIIVTPILTGDPDYLAWIGRETAPRPTAPAGTPRSRKAVRP